MTEKPYSAAVVSMLDRDSQSENLYMFYPITRVELLAPVTLENPDGLPRRVFRVADTGEWEEVQ